MASIRRRPAERGIRQTCDEMLRCLHGGIMSDLSPHECMERLFADTFCILAVYANEEQTLKRFV